MAVNEIQFANFVCKFGKVPMRQFLRRIILPAFTDDKLVRAYGEGTYFHLYDVKLREVTRNGKVRHVIQGRVIKNTMISRDQYFDPNLGIVKDRRALSSSPSAFFVLIIENHRLIYLNETPGAPDLGSFASTMRKFIHEKYNRYIDFVFEVAKNERKGNPDIERVTKKSLSEETPRPKIEVVPLSDPTDIDSFLDRYDNLKRVEFKIIDTNDEIDAGELFQKIRDTFEDLHSTQTKIVSSNPKGLNVETAKEITKEATKSGYQEVKFNGEDIEGNRLVGDNESFALRASLDEIPATDTAIANSLIDRFDHLQDEGLIVLTDSEAELAENQRKLFNGGQ